MAITNLVEPLCIAMVLTVVVVEAGLFARSRT
jgi:multisubunit Na+/H+ antiporter MnhC subunit